MSLINPDICKLVFSYCRSYELTVYSCLTDNELLHDYCRRYDIKKQLFLCARLGLKEELLLVWVNYFRDNIDILTESLPYLLEHKHDKIVKDIKSIIGDRIDYTLLFKTAIENTKIHVLRIIKSWYISENETTLVGYKYHKRKLISRSIHDCIVFDKPDHLLEILAWKTDTSHPIHSLDKTRTFHIAAKYGCWDVFKILENHSKRDFQTVFECLHIAHENNQEKFADSIIKLYSLDNLEIETVEAIINCVPDEIKKMIKSMYPQYFPAK